MTTDEKVIKRGASLYPKDWAYLDEQAGRLGTSASAIIRQLIRNKHEAEGKNTDKDAKAK